MSFRASATTAGFWGELIDREANLFHSTLGMCTPAAFSVSPWLFLNVKFSRCDSDGNLILNMGVSVRSPTKNPTNLTVLVMDNRNYLGSQKRNPECQRRHGGKMKLEQVAKGCGIESSHRFKMSPCLATRLNGAQKHGPHFICAQVEALDLDGPPKNKHVLDRGRTSTNSRNTLREPRCRNSWRWTRKFRLIDQNQ